jgi:hypothetical protein
MSLMEKCAVVVDDHVCDLFFFSELSNTIKWLILIRSRRWRRMNYAIFNRILRCDEKVKFWYENIRHIRPRKEERSNLRLILKKIDPIKEEGFKERVIRKFFNSFFCFDSSTNFLLYKH